jgi:hypothetical protein
LKVIIDAESDPRHTSISAAKQVEAVKQAFMTPG